MHIGNAYAALAAWLGVRSRGGKLVLRIEDIDAPRVVRDADRWIMDDLHWLGLDWDGDPVYQSSRLDRYRQILDALRGMTLDDILTRDILLPAAPADGCPDSNGEPHEESPLIYPCFCSRADIRAASAPNEGDGFIIYPGTCRRLSAAERNTRINRGDRHSWRIAVPGRANPVGTIVFDDEVFGPQRIDLGRQVGDVVIRRSDGLFAYQFVVSIDDFDMGVTQIVRGRDLLRSTAIQLWIRRALESVSPAQTSPVASPATAHPAVRASAAGRRPFRQASGQARSCPRFGRAARGRRKARTHHRLLRMDAGAAAAACALPSLRPARWFHVEHHRRASERSSLRYTRPTTMRTRKTGQPAGASRVRGRM